MITSNSRGLLHSFNRRIRRDEIPRKFTFPFSYEPHQLCIEASDLLKAYLRRQGNSGHNFGLDADTAQNGIGKMFGVLVVEAAGGEIGFLSAFSGGLTRGVSYPGFVPPVYDPAVYNAFVDDGMQEITLINEAISDVVTSDFDEKEEKTQLLKHLRKVHSVSLLDKIFDQYHFLNQARESKSLRSIFEHLDPKSPPGGAGECAAPKLLQYAFQNELKPVAMAEFWWGNNPKKVNVQHGEFYPSCLDKCKPILSHMLKGLDLEEPLSGY